MHITINIASNKIRNVSLLYGSTSSLCRLIWLTILTAIFHCLLCLAPHSANICQLAVNPSLVNPGGGSDHVQLRSRISKVAWSQIAEAT